MIPCRHRDYIPHEVKEALVRLGGMLPMNIFLRQVREDKNTHPPPVVIVFNIFCGAMEINVEGKNSRNLESSHYLCILAVSNPLLQFFFSSRM